MGTRLRLVIVGVIVLGIVIGFIYTGYRFNWPWTGFGSETSEPKQHAKTLWDWLQLLIVPIMLAIGGFWLNQIQRGREQRTTEQQASLERELTRDNQQESLLQAYIDKLSELLEKKLRESKPEDELRKIARVRTLTVLARLDKGRKRSVLQFLYESGLIEKGKSIIDLNGADLSEANLFGVNLFGARLGNADLRGANLREAHLETADLMLAKLNSADLSKAYLIEANLNGANLSLADLREANLDRAKLSSADQREDFLFFRVSEVKLSNADLRGASLIGAEITPEQLAQTVLLEAAIMPDGSKHP